MPIEIFTAAQQDAFVELLELGASPSAACRKIGRTFAEFFHTYNRDGEFRRRCRQADDSLGGNVASALYKAAMQGNVSAQTFWLRQHPPTGWKGDGDMPGGPFDDLSDEELFELAQAHGVDLPPESEPRAESADGEAVPLRLPPEPEADR